MILFQQCLKVWAGIALFCPKTDIVEGSFITIPTLSSNLFRIQIFPGDPEQVSWHKPWPVRSQEVDIVAWPGDQSESDFLNSVLAGSPPQRSLSSS